MLYFDIAFGIFLCVVALFSLIVAVEEPWTLSLFVVFGVLGGLLISAGVHREWANGRAAHAELYRAAVAQGYPVRSDGVHSGYWATIDVPVGRCLLTLEGTKVDGRWRFGVDESGQGSAGGIVFLSPAAVARFREVCPS